MKPFIFELYLFAVIGYTYVDSQHGIKLAGLSLFLWGIIGCMRIANTCSHEKTKRWQTGYGGHYLFQCESCGKIWEETR